MEINTYYIMAALVILCGIIAIVIGVWYNINYGKFTPKIEIFSDGTGRMLSLVSLSAARSRWFVSTQSIKLDKSSIIKDRNMS